MLQDEVFLRCKQINDTGVAILMVEQNARRCLQVCDRGYVLDQGRNAYTGIGPRAARRPEGHRALPRHPRPGVAFRRSTRSLRSLRSVELVERLRRTQLLAAVERARPCRRIRGAAAAQTSRRVDLAALSPTVPARLAGDGETGRDGARAVGPGLSVRFRLSTSITCRRRSRRRGRCRCCRRCRRRACPSGRCPSRPWLRRIFEDSSKPITMIASGSAALISSTSVSNGARLRGRRPCRTRPCRRSRLMVSAEVSARPVP